MIRFSETDIFKTLNRFQYVVQRFFESNSAIFQNIETFTEQPGINGKVRHFWSNFQGFVGILADIKRGCSYNDLPKVVTNLQNEFEELMVYADKHASEIRPKTMTRDTYQTFLRNMGDLSLKILELQQPTEKAVSDFKIQTQRAISPMQFWHEQNRQAQEMEAQGRDLRHGGASTNVKVAVSTRQ